MDGTGNIVAVMDAMGHSKMDGRGFTSIPV